MAASHHEDAGMPHPASLLCCLSLLSALATAPAMAADTPASTPILRGAQCLDPDQARGWSKDDDRHILVDAGRNKYRIEVSPACTAIDYSPILRLRGDPVSGRVCGGLGDAILTRDFPCKIERMELLSKEQYKAALKARPGYRKRGFVSDKSRSG
jgi:hypothetical protein